MTPVNYDPFRERALQLRASEFSRLLDRLMRVLSLRALRAERRTASDGYGEGRPQAC